MHQGGQNKPLSPLYSLHCRLLPGLYRHLHVTSTLAGCPLKKQISWTHILCLVERPNPTTRLLSLSRRPLISQAPLRDFYTSPAPRQVPLSSLPARLYPLDLSLLPSCLTSYLLPSSLLSLVSVYFCLHIFLSFLLLPYFLSPFFPIYLFILQFPETVSFSKPGRGNWLIVTRTLIQGMNCSVEVCLLGWHLKVLTWDK